jgi:DNA processing protein
MTNGELFAYVGFNVFPGIGPARFSLLIDYFGSAEAAWKAAEKELLRVHMPERIVREFVSFRRGFNGEDGKEYFRKLEQSGVVILTKKNPKYPKLLSQISDAPYVLYVKGKRSEIPINLDRTIAVVGTRRITAYGREVTRSLTTELVACGFTIVSGMAYGVDAVAHTAAMDAGGKTIAVLGCGIDIIAPPSNTALYHRIAGGGGAIVSEVPLGIRPAVGLFPARNRIISGLSLGVVVTEGADDSGALITARNAGEQGREVFAVPGPITSAYSRGPARLLKNGAKLVESVDDIMEELGITHHPKTYNHQRSREYAGLTKEEETLVMILTKDTASIDELVRVSGLTTQVVSATLTVLEMKGIVKSTGDNLYRLA